MSRASNQHREAGAGFFLLLGRLTVNRTPVRLGRPTTEEPSPLAMAERRQLSIGDNLGDVSIGDRRKINPRLTRSGTCPNLKVLPSLDRFQVPSIRDVARKSGSLPHQAGEHRGRPHAHENSGTFRSALNQDGPTYGLGFPPSILPPPQRQSC